MTSLTKKHDLLNTHKSGGGPLNPLRLTFRLARSNTGNPVFRTGIFEEYCAQSTPPLGGATGRNDREISLVVQQYVDRFDDRSDVLLGTGSAHARLSGSFCQLTGEV